MNFTDKCSILAGGAGQDDVVLVTVMNDGLAEERQQHAIPLLYRQGGWRLAGEEKVLPWLVAGIANSGRGSSEFVIVGWAGQVLVVEDGKSRREAIQKKDDYVSIVRAVARIDDAIYTVGMRRQAHKRLGSNRWTEIDRDVAYRGDEPAIGFNAIDGFDGDEFYAVGLNGEMWRYDKGKWHEILSATNVHLHSVCCAGNGQVYVGGRSGLILRGRHDSWEILDLENDQTIWDLHWFANKLFVLLDRRIHQVVDDELRAIEDVVIGADDFHSFSSVDGKLWVFGRKKIVQYDGSSWSQLDCVLPDTFDDSDVLGFFNDDVLSMGSDYLEDVD